MSDLVRVVTGDELRAKKAALLEKWPQFASIERVCCESHMEDEAMRICDGGSRVRWEFREYRNCQWLLGELP